MNRAASLPPKYVRMIAWYSTCRGRERSFPRRSRSVSYETPVGLMNNGQALSSTRWSELVRIRTVGLSAVGQRASAIRSATSRLAKRTLGWGNPTSLGQTATTSRQANPATYTAPIALDARTERPGSSTNAAAAPPIERAAAAAIQPE